MLWRNQTHRIYTLSSVIKSIMWWSLVGLVVAYVLYILEAATHGVI
jgi:hypothetical protein